MKQKSSLNANSDRSNQTPELVNNKRLISPDDIAALRKGDTHAYDKIYRAWYNPIYLTLTKLTGSEVEAEDIAQEVFTDLWLTRKKLDPGKKMNTYLYKLARNSVIDYFRRKRVAENYLDTMDWDEMSQNSSDDLIIEKEMKLFRKIALGKMSVTQRYVYTLSHDEGLSNEDISKRLGITKETVYSLKSRARKQLEELFRLLTILTLIP